MDQHKLVGIPIEVAVMTNLSQEHLDYHRTMERYAAAKARLFNRYMKPRYCVLNSDDERYEYYRTQSVGKVTTYGKKSDSTMRITSEKTDVNGGSWSLITPDGDKLNLRTQLAGEFNIYNASAAAAVGEVLGIDHDSISAGVAALGIVPGRMESIIEGQNFTVWVDYAVTPDSLEKVLAVAKAAATGKVAIVFGATGDRDREKRPVMGAVVAGLADRIYLTDDETYTEDPSMIIQAVKAGIDKNGGTSKTKVFDDRREAIKTAFADAKAGDVVILTGMGHQDTRNMGGKLVAWDERKIAHDLLNRSKR
ncbi:MAG: UDP-N-acetylmuramyl-tripeptide synthetase [Candidatus Saccharimonadales bacterium]